MDLLIYVLMVGLGLVSVWLTACIYLTIRYNDDGEKYIVYKYRKEDDECYTYVQEIGSVRFPTAYLIVSAMPEFKLASTCDENDERRIVIVPTLDDKEALAFSFDGTLKRALSRKYVIHHLH